VRKEVARVAAAAPRLKLIPQIQVGGVILMRRRLYVGLVLIGLFAVLAVGSVAFAHTSSLTIDPQATLSPGGTVITVTGTVTCTTGETFSIQVRVFQGRGNNQESAFGFMPMSQLCTGAPQLWEVEAVSSTGAFREGKADAAATNSTFGADGFAQKNVGRTIQLTSG
jgi:hypothetical protein